MGMRIHGVTALTVLLRQGGERAVRRAREQMKREGERIAQLARDFAPVDIHGPGGRHDPPGRELERSIRAERFYEDNRRLAVQVVAGGMVGGVNVDDYALEMHESLDPAGDLRLGPGSLAKAAGGKLVGGKFLERALNEREPHMVDDIAAEIRQEIER